MALPLIQPPKQFEPGSNPAEAWSEWKAAYHLYETACEYSAKPEATRRALLLHVMGPTARKIVETFRFSSPAEGEQRTDTVAALFERFDERYLPYKKVTQATSIFSTMCQKENQPIDDFIAELQHQASMCNFGDKHDRLLGDRIIVGIRDAALRERLLRERLDTGENHRHVQSGGNLKTACVLVSNDWGWTRSDCGQLEQKRQPIPTTKQATPKRATSVSPKEQTAHRNSTSAYMRQVWNHTPAPTVARLRLHMLRVWAIRTLRECLPSEATNSAEKSSRTSPKRRLRQGIIRGKPHSGQCGKCIV